ncbi:RNA-dependent RNA polymerase [Ganoderma sinense ZZ0214-1]|uniref:RNA-dependent RNA polymerase n=1 Tax=Ganoderma sinense ZZ0214-1 TaxID=1077348 RepID=A0A2G8SPC2_9APHY|nr:RNA-dependent RNA polymerase [Ganoderma sinense ZZ0214-1]
MNIQLEDIPKNAQKWEVKEALSQLLHYHPDFRDPSARDTRLLNFEVSLEPSHNGLASNGKGTLTLPHKTIGDKFLHWARRNAVYVNRRKLWVCSSNVPVKRGLVEALNRTPYLDPKEQAERQEKLEQIRQIRIVLEAVQFGVYYHRPEDPATANRYFSIEFDIYREDTISGELLFDYNRKLFRVEMGNCVTEDTVDHVVIDLNNIKKSAYGYTPDGQFYVCFEFWQPPRLERQARLRAYTGDRRQDARDFRERLPHLGGEHEVIAPFAYQLRLVLTDSRARRDVKRLCLEAGIPTPSKVQINVDRKGFFCPDKLKTARQLFLSYDWPVRFQLEALLRSGLAHTDDVLGLCDDVSELVRTQDIEFTADFLRRFGADRLRSKGNGETVLECFKAALKEELADPEAPDEGDSPRTRGSVQCAHAIVTPTRVLLQGPYDTQSNRVIRKYYEYREYFIRVEFREETGLSFRWPLEVNGRSLIEQRFGKILKEGLVVAGRTFRFLGYSTSGLREHTVWFMSDFEHPEEGMVTPDKIRSGLGDFRSCINHPSKYAARIAQAFSGTDPSYKIRIGQWTEGVVDLGNSPYEFTDGQGTVSVELRDRIWDVLCEAWPDKRRLKLKPSAFQIRFLGCKGIVVVDERLEGIHMKLRNSMRKFAVDNATEAEIEIAKAFIKPGPARLCRPLISVLEDLGVFPEAFLVLQERAITSASTARDTIRDSIGLLHQHDLGNVYGLGWILKHLQDAGMGMSKEKSPSPPKYIMNNGFIHQLIKFARTHVLSEIKHDARIAIPDAFQLVGCVDEGPAYIAEGHDPEDVLCLKEGEIFACVQQPDTDEPIYIRGLVSISRSPHIHPGDGKRSLASMLAGGDVDGDEFLVIKDETLLPNTVAEPASYVGVKPKLLDRESTIDDICNFFMEYMQSDVVGLVADLHLTIADQSRHGTFDRDCMTLAGLCSQAVDYPKNGMPVNLDNLPHTIIHAKPDWKKPEDGDYRPADFYESDRALGKLFRKIQIQPITPPSSSYPNGAPLDPAQERPLTDNISKALRPAVEKHLGRFTNPFPAVKGIEPLFRHYARELGYICLTHAPSENTDVRLCEEEVALGAILAKCSQRRWKKDRMHRMREHAAQLVRDRQRALGAPLHRGKDGEGPPEEELHRALERAWAAWDFGMRYRTAFGAQSFALIALGVVCDMLEKLEKKGKAEGSTYASGGNSESGTSNEDWADLNSV